MGKLKKYFRRLRDPRAANASYPLLEILFVALAAVLCGAKSCTDMSDFGRRKINLLRRFVPLEKGVPSHDVFSDVFRMLDPIAFERVFRNFVSAFAKFHGLDLSGVFAVDGKSLCGAYERGKSALPVHLVNVFAAKARMALASRKAPGRNESEAALEVLRMLRLKRKIVTADALFCSRPFAKTVLDQGGNYVLALKKNQGKVFAVSIAHELSGLGSTRVVRFCASAWRRIDEPGDVATGPENAEVSRRFEPLGAARAVDDGGRGAFGNVGAAVPPLPGSV